MNQVLKVLSSISQNNDDGREKNNATWYPSGSTGNVITLGKYDSVVQHGAFRFRDIHIPKDARIAFARLKLRPAVTDSGDPNVKLKIKGITEANALPFSQSSRPTERTHTVNSVSWDIIKGWEVHEWVQTPNLALIVEEIVAQEDWKIGSAIAFVSEDNGSEDGECETCWDKSKGEGYQAELEIWYCTSEVTVAYLAGNDRDGVEIDETEWQGTPDGNVITLGHDGSLPCDGGFIFSGLDIPKRAQIISAVLLLTEADQNNRFPNLMIKGFAEDDATPFSADGSNRPSTRTKTAAQKEWTIGHEASGIFVGEHWSSESVYKSPDLKEIIQEIVDRDGWEEDSKIGLVLENYYSWSGHYKLPWDYVKETGKYGAKLLIVWQRERNVQSSDPDLPKYEKANAPEFIIIHHSATARDATHFQTIKNNHIGIGWGDIGYHHWIAGALDGDGLHGGSRQELRQGEHRSLRERRLR